MSAAWVEVPFEVHKPLGGLRVDAYLARRLRRYSRGEVQRLIAAGRVFLRGKPAKASAKVSTGQVVLIRYPKREEPPCPHDALPVIYEDGELLAVNKPAGVLSHPTDKVLDNTATSILKKQFPGLRLHLAHRLDRETSGVLLLAKDPGSAQTLAMRFYRRECRKEYLAAVLGEVSWEHKLLDLPLRREGGEIKVRQAAGEGASAVTSFERLSVGGGFSLVRAEPRTGRLHQIRAHLAHLGHPVAGDKLYIGQGEAYLKAVRKELTPEDLAALGADRQLLHAWTLRLRHPATDRELTLRAALPSDFLAFLDRAEMAAP